MKKWLKRVLLGIVGLVFLLYFVHLCFRTGWVDEEGLEDVRLEPNFTITKYEDLPIDGYYHALVKASQACEKFTKSIKDTELEEAFDAFSKNYGDLSAIEAMNFLLSNRPQFLNDLDELPVYEEVVWPCIGMNADQGRVGAVHEVFNWLLADIVVHAHHNKWHRVERDVEILASACAFMNRGVLLDSLIRAAYIAELSKIMMILHETVVLPESTLDAYLTATSHIMTNDVEDLDVLRVELMDMNSLIGDLYDGTHSDNFHVRGSVPFYMALFGSTKGQSQYNHRMLSAWFIKRHADPGPSLRIDFRQMADRYDIPSIFFLKDPVGFVAMISHTYTLFGSTDHMRTGKFNSGVFPIWLALRAYKAEHGENVKSLSELEPRYLKSVAAIEALIGSVYYYVHEDTWCLTSEELKSDEDFQNWLEYRPRNMVFEKPGFVDSLEE